MTITVEISEEIAAAVFANAWGRKGGRTLPQIVEGIIVDEANGWRRQFEGGLTYAVAELRRHLAETATPQENLTTTPQP